jgi:hypothetical protein
LLADWPFGIARAFISFHQPTTLLSVSQMLRLVELMYFFLEQEQEGNRDEQGYFVFGVGVWAARWKLGPGQHEACEQYQVGAQR